MPPLKGIDRGLTGEILKALEESGHGRRVAVVDASYNIPRWAEVKDYRGESSVEAMVGILSLVPYEGKILVMMPDEGEAGMLGNDGPFCDEVIQELDDTLDERADTRSVHRSDSGTLEGSIEPGFYTMVNNESVDTLFIRTIDRMPYACASFIVGHMQTEEA